MKSLEEVSSKELRDTDAIISSDTIYSGIVSSTEQIIAVPASAQFVLFNSTGNFYVNYDITTTVPTGSVSQAGGELNPSVRYIGDIANIHLIAPSSTVVTLTFYDK